MAARIEAEPSCTRSSTSTCSLPYAVVRGEVAPMGKTVSSSYAPGPPLHGV